MAKSLNTINRVSYNNGCITINIYFRCAKMEYPLNAFHACYKGAIGTEFKRSQELKPIQENQKLKTQIAFNKNI